MADNQPERSERLFTLDEANSALVLIDTMMSEAVECWDRIQAVNISVTPVTPGNGHGTKAAIEQSKALAVLEENGVKFCALMGEIGELGAVVHQIEERTVHFPHLHGIELGYLCWRVGEDMIGYFHTDDERCKGRRPLQKK